MKGYELSCRSYIDPTKPAIMRIDGHGFSKFTRGLKKPFEDWLHEAMVYTTSELMNEFNANIGYT
jgi:tRNA(His) guanylyltransferase